MKANSSVSLAANVASVRLTRAPPPVIMTTMKVAALGMALVLIIVARPSSASRIIKPIAPGVATSTQEIATSPPSVLNVLTVDLSQPGVRLEATPGQDTLTGPTGDITKGRAEVRDTAHRRGAVAAVNGDFFPYTGDPLGVGIDNGELYSEPYSKGRAALGVGVDGRTILFDTLAFMGEVQSATGRRTFITGVNRMVSATDTADLVVFTPRYGPSSGARKGCVEVTLTNVNLPLRPSKLLIGTVQSINPGAAAGSPIPATGVVLSALPGGPAAAFLLNELAVGKRAELVCAIAPAPDLTDAVRLALLPRETGDLPSRDGANLNRRAFAWATVQQAIGGGPRLVTDGKITVDAIAQGFNNSFTNDPNPRTAAGVTKDGKLLLMTIDGRQAISKGVSLTELAEAMIRYGAVDAINFDGGGSTTMVVKDMAVNATAGAGDERPVADVLCVYANAQPGSSPPGSDPPLSILPPAAPIFVGNEVQLAAQLGSQRVSGDSLAFLWGGAATNGVGFVSQDGVFHALRSGTGEIALDYLGQKATARITVLSAPTALETYTLSGRLTTPSSDTPEQTQLSIRITGTSGAPLANALVRIKVSGGDASASVAKTDADGAASIGITWTDQSGSVTLAADGVKSVTVNWP